MQKHLLAWEIAHALSVELKSLKEEKKNLFDNSDPNTQLENLIWMCKQVQTQEDWPSSKRHRWLGYVQGVLIALGISTVEDEKKLVAKAKEYFIEYKDTDLKDHNDPDSPFQIDIGGEG